MADLPPTDPNAEHAPKRPRHRSRMPVGTRIGAMSTSDVSLAKELTGRAKNAAIRARMNQRIDTTVTLEIYKATVELAEEYERPIRDIVRQCFLDGLRRYKQFRMPYGPFGQEASTSFLEAAPAMLHPEHAPVHDVAHSYRAAAESTQEILAERNALASFLVPSPSPPGQPAKNYAVNGGKAAKGTAQPTLSQEFEAAEAEGDEHFEETGPNGDVVAGTLK